MAATKLFTLCLRPHLEAADNASNWLRAAKNRDEIEAVFGWTRRTMAKRAQGLYLVFPRAGASIHWDERALEAIARANDLPLSEEMSPLFEVRMNGARIYSRAQMNNRAPWWKLWRRYRIEPAVIHA